MASIFVHDILVCFLVKVLAKQSVKWLVIAAKASTMLPSIGVIAFKLELI